MQIKSIFAGAAIALAATIGSASAAEQFTTLEGVTAVAISPGELGTVVGGTRDFRVTPPTGATTFKGLAVGGPLVGGVANGYKGLSDHAVGVTGGVIIIP